MLLLFVVCFKRLVWFVVAGCLLVGFGGLLLPLSITLWLLGLLD